MSAKSRSAFTLIETLVVVAIVVAVSVGGFLGLAGFRNKQALEAGLDEFRAAVEGTKRRSVAQEEGSRWGMRFTNATSGVSSYTVFKGSSYTTSGVDRLYSFRTPVGFANPSASSTYDAVFAPLTGALSENKVISLIGGSDGLVGDLILRTIGSITARTDKEVAGYWHLDEGTSTVAYDASGYANTGTLTNGPTWQSGSNCKAGNCLSFDGTDDYVLIASGFPQIGSSFSLSVWIKFDDLIGWQTVLGRDTDTAISRGAFYFQLADLTLGASDVEAGSVTADHFSISLTLSSGKVVAAETLSALSAGTWYHVIATYDGADLKFYLNGILEDTTAYSLVPLNQNSQLTVGAGYYNNSIVDFVDGNVDEVRIYNRVLSASEIEAMYNDLK